VSGTQGLWHKPRRERGRRTQRRPTAWIRVSVEAVDHPDIAELSDAAFRCLITVWSRAKRQPEPGVFRSEEQLLRAIGWRLARCLPALYAASLLVREGEASRHEARSGRVEVENWSRWQSDGRQDRTHADRQMRYRERERAKRDASRDGVTGDGGVTTSDGGPPTPVGSAAVTPPAGAADVTLTAGSEDLATRRALARVIRDAKREDHRRRWRTRFDRLYGHLYGREATS
jgi:hypothetical protein